MTSHKLSTTWTHNFQPEALSWGKKNLPTAWQPAEQIEMGLLRKHYWTQTVLKDPHRALCDSRGDQITGREIGCQ